MKSKNNKKYAMLKKAALMTAVAIMCLPNYTVVAADGSESNLLRNASFDTNGWEAVGEAGIQKQNSHEGKNCFYINRGESNSFKQSVTVPASGNYTLSAWLLTGDNENASFKVVDAENGGIIKTYTADGNKTCQGYVQCQLDDIALEEGQKVEIVFEGISNAWINGDQVAFYNNETQKNLIKNGDIEISDWDFINNAEIDDSNPHTGKYHFTLNAGTENRVKQHVEVAEEGDYTLSAWFSSAADNGHVSIIDSESGATLTDQVISASEDYTEYTLETVHLAAGAKVDIICTGGNGWIKGDDLSLSSGAGKVDPIEPLQEFTDKHDILGFEASDENITRKSPTTEPLTFTFDEEGSNLETLGWKESSYRWQPGCDISSSGRNNSNCLRVCGVYASRPNTVECKKTIKLKPNTRYTLEGYVKGSYIDYREGAAGPRLSIYGTNLYSREATKLKGDFDWTHMKVEFETPNDGVVTRVCQLGYRAGFASGTAYFDDLKITEMEDTTEGKHMKLSLDSETVADNISDAKLKNWVHNLDNAYVAYANLTGMTPYDGEQIDVEISDDPIAVAWAGNPIHWQRQYIPAELQRIEANENWSFCLLHEIGHDFDSEYGQNHDCGWNFHGELFANFKMAYVLERLNGTVYQDRAYKGKEIEEYYRADAGNAYTKSIENKSAANMSEAAKQDTYKTFNDGVTYCFMRIKNKIGWEPFQLTFREFISENIHPSTRLEKFDKFLELLQANYNPDGTEVNDTFKEGELAFIRSILKSMN